MPRFLFAMVTVAVSTLLGGGCRSKSTGVLRHQKAAATTGRVCSAVEGKAGPAERQREQEGFRVHGAIIPASQLQNVRIDKKDIEAGRESGAQWPILVTHAMNINLFFALNQVDAMRPGAEARVVDGPFHVYCDENAHRVYLVVHRAQAGVFPIVKAENEVGSSAHAAEPLDGLSPLGAMIGIEAALATPLVFGQTVIVSNRLPASGHASSPEIRDASRAIVLDDEGFLALCYALLPGESELRWGIPETSASGARMDR